MILKLENACADYTYHVKHLVLRSVIKLLVWVYHIYMKTSIATNGKEVAIFETPSGVKGYVDTSIPQEANDGLIAKLEADLGLNTSSSQSDNSSHRPRQSTD